jgi:signal transduction histidine kinase
LTSQFNSTSANKSIKSISILVILAAIIVFSILASVLLYSIQAAEFRQIAKEEANTLKNDLSDKSFYVSQLASQHLASIKKITQILSNAKSFQSGDVDRIKLLLDAADLDSSDVVDSFFILDKDSVLLYSTNTDPDAASNIGKSFPDHVTYTNTRETMKSFISPLTLGSDNSSRIFVASPIIDDQTGEFKGTVSAAIRADTFAQSIEKIVIPKDSEPNSESLSLIDPEGRIMYSGSSGNNLGKNILSDEVLSAIPSGIKEGLVASLKEAVAGTSGIYELNLAEHPELITSSSNSGSSTQSTTNPFDYVLISYTPVKVDDQIVMISFVTKAASIKTILHENEILGGSYMFIVMYGMLGTMTAFAVAIIVINRRLTTAVNSKTREIEESNKQLREAAEQIAEQAKELREADVKKSEFSAMITHELKTPLVSIIGYGSMLLNGKIGELAPNQRHKLQIMYKNAQRLTELIQDILDVQKVELGELHLNVKEASARDLIEQSINSLKPHAETKNIRLSNSLKDDLKLECDSGRIVQVLNNLVNNGIKFSPLNSRIDIGAKLEDHSIIFNVKDNGIGIPAEKQSKLFTKFYQADTSLTRKAGGTGLGLVISKGIVETHRGKIWVESEAGKGSIFSFSIPVGERVGKQENSSSR